MGDTNDRSSQDIDITQQVESIRPDVDPETYLNADGTAWCVEMVRGPAQGQTVILSDGSTLYGREEDCDVFLDDITVSRKHCAFELEDDAVTIKDLGSTNGTYVNSQAIETKLLEAGDVVQIGKFVFVLTRRSA